MARRRWGSAFTTATAILLRAALLLGLWVGLTDNTRLWDTVTGLVCALLAGAAMHLAARAGRVSLQVRGRWLRRVAAAPWWIVRDTLVILRALAVGLMRREAPRGRMRPVRWQPGGDRPLDQGRRALAYGPGSAGPNQYVVGASDEDGVLLVHELEPASSVSAIDVVGEEAP